MGGIPTINLMGGLWYCYTHINYKSSGPTVDVPRLPMPTPGRSLCPTPAILRWPRPHGHASPCIMEHHGEGRPHVGPLSCKESYQTIAVAHISCGFLIWLFHVFFGFNHMALNKMDWGQTSCWKMWTCHTMQRYVMLHVTYISIYLMLSYSILSIHNT